MEEKGITEQMLSRASNEPVPTKRLPLVKVKADTKSGFMLINEKDFDSRIHQKWEESSTKSKTVAAKKEDAPEGRAKLGE